jgi:uncharacterized DUF497 family protein
MRIEFDPAKDEANAAKHGLSLRLSLDLDWDAATSWIDDRRDYGEKRLSALGEFGGQLYFVAFVERGDVKRIISLRRANRREVREYARSKEAQQALHADAGRGPGDHGGGQS